MPQNDPFLSQIRISLDLLKQDKRQPKDSTLDGYTSEGSFPLQLNTESTGGHNSPQGTENSPVTLKNLPGRGVGVVATRLIPVGSIILQEDAIVTLPGPPVGTTPEFLSDLVNQYLSCSPEMRQRVLSLHAYKRPGHEVYVRGLFAAAHPNSQLTDQEVNLVYRLHAIFTTNMFDDTAPSKCSLFLDASRFNHSCLPNCDYGHTSKDNIEQATITVRTSRDIQPGEELTLTYLINYEPRDKRMADTKRYWGFQCNCPACDVADPRVDTDAHEHMLAEYRRLKQDPYLEIQSSLSLNLLSTKDLDDALDRSVQRTRIVQALGDNYATMQHLLISSGICRRKWLLTGDAEEVKSQIRFLELGWPLAETIAPSRPGQAMMRKMERSLTQARKLKSIL